MMMHVAPHLVLPLSEAGAGRARKPAIRGMRAGWAWAPRRWTQVTTDTGIGNPAAATAEKGTRYFAALTSEIGGFLVELASADPEHLYQDT